MAKKSPSIPPSAPESARRQVEATPVEELLAQAEGPGDRAEEFVRSHLRTIVIATVGALLIVAMVVATRGYQQHRANLAAQAFTSASGIDEFEAVVRTYPGTVAAGNSLLRKAELLWEQGETQLSTDTLEQFLREFETHPLRPQTLISLGSRLEELERASAAEVHYKAVIENFADTPYAPMAQLRLAEIELAAGNLEAGRSLLEQMPSTFPLYGPNFVALAEERIEQLDAGLPTSPIPPPADAPVAPAPVIPGLDLGPLPDFMPDGLELVPGLTPDAPGLDQPLPDVPPLGEDLPVVPDTPETPGLPETPAAPEAPAPVETPAMPETPAAPVTPEAPPAPEEQPVTPEPPVIPEPPATPEAPAVPEPPTTPATPAAPEAPAAPPAPNTPEPPQEPALPQEADPSELSDPAEEAPEPSEEPAQPAAPEVDDQADTSEPTEESP